jgi:hypothetical protein
MSGTGNAVEPPGWLGIIAFFGGGLLTPLIVFWAYRRGQRVGVGRTDLDPPSDMVRQTIGWGLACFVPILAWYAVVHLPTEWYKHGVRVGALRGQGPERFTSGRALAATVFGPAVLVFSVIVALIAVGGGENAGVFEVGNCVEYQGAVAVEKDCSTSHDARVTKVWEIPSGDLPSEAEFDSYAADNCPGDTTGFLYPDRLGWSRGDRDLVCLAED